MGITFRQALGLAISQTDQCLRRISDEAEVPLAALEAALREADATVTVSQAQSVAAYFGSTLDHFLQDRQIADHVHVAQLHSALPPLLRAQLEAFALSPDEDPDQSR